MRRRLWCLALWLGTALAIPSSAAATDAVPAAPGPVIHERGDFRFGIGPVPAFVVPRDIPETWDTEIGQAPGDPWRGWLYDRQVDLRGGDRIEYADNAYEARATSLLGSVGRVEVEFNPLYQTLTLHAVRIRRDGVWLDRLDPALVQLMRREEGFSEDRSDGLVSALMVLDDVRVGDVVRVMFSVRGENPVLDGEVLAQGTTARTVPVLRRSMRVLFDPGVDVDVKARGAVDAAIVERIDRPDATELSYSMRGVPPIVDTKDYPAWYTPYPLLQFSERRSWGDVVAWARPLYPDDAPLPDELQARVGEWKRLPRPEAIAAALRLAQEDIRYFAVSLGENTHRPNLPAVTWARRYGDCKDKALLLAALLRELDIEAGPALVSFADGAAVRDSLPAANAFDHVIVRARVDGRTLWLDATATGQRGDVYTRDVHPFGVALPVAAGVDRLEEIVAPEVVDSRVVVVESFTPQAEGDAVELEVVTDYSGTRADTMRRRIDGQRFDRLAENYADYYRRRYGEVDVVQPATVQDDERANRLRTVERYRLRDPWRAGKGRVLELSAVPLGEVLALPSRVQRDAPIALEGRGVRRYEAKVVVPEGWRSPGALGDSRFEGGPVTYSRQFVRGADLVTVVQEWTSDADHVAVDEVASYVDAIRSADSESAIRVALTPIESARRAERDERLESLLRESLDKE